MEKLYTLGQVAERTGIDKRTLKYYVERKIIIPSKKSYQGKKGYWLYTEKDIIKIKQIALYRELGYSAQQIKYIINSPNFSWITVLDHQIKDFKAKKRHLENLIFAAEMMRYSSEVETKRIDFDISDFDNDIDRFAVSTFGTDEDDVMAQGLEEVSNDIEQCLRISDIKEQGQKTFEILTHLRKIMDNDPSSAKTQETIFEIITFFSSILNEEEINSKDILFGLRLISNLSVDRISDLIFSKEGSLDFLIKALQIHCDKIKEGEVDG